MKDFVVSNVSKILEEAAKQSDFEIMKLMWRQEKIRKEHGHYIFVYPVKWRDENNKTYKQTFAWSIEFENGRCEDLGHQAEEEFATYLDALKSAIDYATNSLNQ